MRCLHTCIASTKGRNCVFHYRVWLFGSTLSFRIALLRSLGNTISQRTLKKHFRGKGMIYGRLYRLYCGRMIWLLSPPLLSLSRRYKLYKRHTGHRNTEKGRQLADGKRGSEGVGEEPSHTTSRKLLLRLFIRAKGQSYILIIFYVHYKTMSDKEWASVG